MNKGISGSRVSVRPLTSIDERYLTSSVVWDISRLAVSFVMSAPPSRSSSGGLNMPAFFELFESLTHTFPRLRQKIMRPLLGIHAPAWVVDDKFDITWHVRRYPHVVAAQQIPPRLLAGLENGAMEPGRPPWDVLVAELDDGGLMMSLRYHHVVGDGMFGRSMVLELTRPKDVVRFVPAPLARAPRNRIAVSFASARAFWGSVGSGREAWQRINRVPIRRRLRRVAARNTRPLREWLGQRSGRLPAVARREPRRLSLEFPAFRRYARTCGGGVGDLTAAVMAAALSKMAPERERIQLMIPISGRARGDDPAGNQVKVLVVDLPAGDDLARLTASVAAQVAQARNTGDFPPLQPGIWDAYATFLPGPPRPGSILGYAVHSVGAWTAMDPRERYGIVASTCGPQLELGMMTGQGGDADALSAAVEEVVAATTRVSV